MQTSSKKPLPQYYTPEEVAESLGVTRRSVYDWLSTGSLVAGRAGRRWVITPEQVAAFVQVRNAPAVEVPSVTVQAATDDAPSQSRPQKYRKGRR